MISSNANKCRASAVKPGSSLKGHTDYVAPAHSSINTDSTRRGDTCTFAQDMESQGCMLPTTWAKITSNFQRSIQHLHF